MSNQQNAQPIIGTVVIGRNEGLRLENCLKSLVNHDYPVIYVDSGSTDKSLEIANALASYTHALDTAKPFSAARARNEGFDLLLKKYPNIQYVQFIDGDCILDQGWFKAAIDTMHEDQKRAGVVGHLTERHPERSVYNRLCALEWKSPVGDLTNYGALGGISMLRADVFQTLNGFKENVIAGEDSELGVRMSLLGYKVTKIDQAMATHDANMLSFAQWWKRAVRAGHAIGQRAALNGNTAAKDCVQERKSTLVWGILTPIVTILLLIPSKGWSLLALSVYALLAFKVYRFKSKQGESANDAWTYAKFIVLAKFANGLGLIKYYLNSMRNSYKIIEYK